MLSSSDIWDRAIKNKGALLSLGLLGGASYILWNAFKNKEEEGYISAQGLGRRGIELEHYLGGGAEDDAKTTNILASGETFHKVIQKLFERTEGAKYEVPVIDRALGIKGRIDMLLEDNIPVEIKTISHKGIENLGAPLPAHESQVNFYAHARKAKYGYVLYLDGEDISNTKVFRVGYSPSRLLADVANTREHMALNPGKLNEKASAWRNSRFPVGPAIRHSDSPYSWDSINQNSEFPGGRLNSVVQASRYDIVRKSHICIPTMGLTIRKSETAIGHKSRSKGAKYSKPTILYNGSRRYRS